MKEDYRMEDKKNIIKNKISCEECEEGEERVASKQCLGCEIDLCEDCAIIHCHCDGCECEKDIIDIKKSKEEGQ